MVFTSAIQGFASMPVTTMQWIGVAFFALAVPHTFSTKGLQHFAYTSRHHAGVWYLLGAVEVVFGLWAMGCSWLSAAHRNCLASLARGNWLFLQAIWFPKPGHYF
jgi:hypothetical protein